jgi:hypothetical protein
MIYLLLLSASVLPDELKSIPDVVEVTVRSVDKPTHRVIHILDWHYVSEKRFRLDSPEGDFDAFLDSVDSLQKQQRALLKAIGVKSVFVEGLTAESKPAFLKRVGTLKKYKPTKRDGPLDDFVAQLRREDLLELGAPAAMLVDGELESLESADDADLHRAADPIKGDKVEVDEAANKAREDGIVKLLLAKELAVVILGGEHDLTDNLPASVEYIRVTLRGYRNARQE